MKRTFSLLLATMACMFSWAQDIQLPAPNQAAKSLSVSEALATRHSVRSFESTPLSQQQLSDLCWAACGMSRDDNHRTAPTAMNRQEIRLFVFNTEAVYEYEAKTNKLIRKADGDQRSLIAGGGGGFRQDFVLQAPISLLMVVDYDLFGNDGEHAKIMCNVDAGIVCENINLYCQAVGLATVPRASHDAAGLKKLLHLSDKQVPILNNPIGIEKK